LLPTALRPDDRVGASIGGADDLLIYFDFDRDTLRPESGPVLKEIADDLANHPDWQLSIGGHTDNIGPEGYNLDLSRRRAAAVKRALVDEYHIDSERLTTEGFGASRPKESNETRKGRAHNRRVQLGQK
jgi:outer membrane protein OmpA-like peptidoglycan-associated protein